MKIIQYCSCVFVFLFLVNPANSAGSVENRSQINTFEVLNSSAHFLVVSGGRIIDMEGLNWIARGMPWADVMGKSIRLKAFVGKGPEFAINRYGDLKGKIFMAPHGWMQKYWVAAGKAVVSGAGPYPTMIQNALLEAEEGARISKAGKWSHWTVISASALSEFSGRKGFQIVEGQVKNVRKIRGISYVNFGDDWKTDFTAAISSKNQVNFKRLNWKLTDLVNKWVRVRGRVRSYNGPYMELIFPEQIEILE